MVMVDIWKIDDEPRILDILVGLENGFRGTCLSFASLTRQTI